MAAPTYAQPKAYLGEIKTIRFQATIPASILDSAYHRKRTRFYGEVSQAHRRFAIHLYDLSVARTGTAEKPGFNSRLDVFEEEDTRWWPMHHLEVGRPIWDDADPLQIRARLYWLKPLTKQTPLLYVDARARFDGNYGVETKLFGVLDGLSGSNAFLCFNEESPVSMGPVYECEFGALDSKRQMTVYTTASFPAETSHGIRVWTGTEWGWRKEPGSY